MVEAVAARNTSPIDSSFVQGVEQLPAGDARRELAGLVGQHIAARSAGQTSPFNAGQLGILRQIQENPLLKFSEMPVELAAAILSSQHESAQAILDGWSDSIALQAELAKQAQARIELVQQQTGRDASGAPVSETIVARESKPGERGAGFEPSATFGVATGRLNRYG